MSFFAKSKSSPRFSERHEKTYILPSAYGVAFGCICLLLFGIGFASTNNAVYFLCFFMVALGSQSLVMTNRNTEKLKITQLGIDDYFADESGVLKILVHNPSLEALEKMELTLPSGEATVIEFLEAGARREVLLPLKLNTPGYHEIPPLRVSSEHPYYFARSWKKHFHSVKATVFPERKGITAFSKTAFVNRALESQSLDDFKGHRDYQTTDTPRSIDWRVTARVQKMMVKEYDPQSSRKITLRWEDCPQSSEDLKKSQLSLWIDLADKNSFEYALELPHRQVSFGHGPQHKAECLKALL